MDQAGPEEKQGLEADKEQDVSLNKPEMQAEEPVAAQEPVKEAPEAVNGETVSEKQAIEPEVKQEEPVIEKQEEVDPKVEQQAESAPEKKEIGERRWYIIQTYSGQEAKVKMSINRVVEQQGLQDRIYNVLVPEEELIEVKGGKRTVKTKKMFPGYIFLEMALDNEVWYFMREIPGVAKFIGTKNTPTPVVDREMQRILKQLGVKAEKLEVSFEVGESVRIISGPFRGYTGSVGEVNQERGKLKVLVNIFGRDTPVEVNFEHAERMT